MSGVFSPNSDSFSFIKYDRLRASDKVVVINFD